MRADDAVRALLARWLPGRALSLERAPSGGSTPVYRVADAASGQVWYLRLAEEPGESRAAEAKVHRLLTAAGLPVPAVLGWEAAPPELDRGAMLTSRIPGTALLELPRLDPGAVADAARTAGRDLARINAVPVRGFGWVRSVAADGALVAEHPTRAAWTAEYAQAASDLATTGLLDRQHLVRLEHHLARWLSLPDQSDSRLAHGDFDASHIFLDDEPPTYSGVIDFGEIRGADPLYDLGHALVQDSQPDRPPIFPALLAGYQDMVPLSADAAAMITNRAVAIATRQLAIFHRRASPATAWLATRLVALVTEPELMHPAPPTGDG